MSKPPHPVLKNGAFLRKNFNTPLYPHTKIFGVGMNPRFEKRGLLGCGGKFFIWFLVLGFAILFIPFNLAADTDIDRIISSWQERYGRLSTYVAQFTQTIYYDENLKEETSGTIFFKKPNFFRWEVKSPEEQIIVGDGEMVWIYLPKYNQIAKKNYFPEESFGPFWFTSTEPIKKIKHNFIIRRPFSVKTSEQTIEILEFQPKGEVLDINRVNLWIEPRNFLPLKVEVFLKDGTLTQFVYKDIKTDVPLSDSLFKIKPPEGIEIFEE